MLQAGQSGIGGNSLAACLAEWAGNATALCALDTLASQPFLGCLCEPAGRERAWRSTSDIQLLPHPRLGVTFPQEEGTLYG